MATIDLNADFSTLSETKLHELYQGLIAKEQGVLEERKRREALPFIWASEQSMILQIRTAMNFPTPGVDEDAKEWAKPTSLMNAHVKGDRVIHDGKTWIATGPGQLMVEPGVTEPIKGECWITEN